MPDDKVYRDINSLMNYLSKYHSDVLGEFFIYRYGGDISTLWKAQDFAKPARESLAKIPFEGETLQFQKPKRKSNRWNRFLKGFKFRAKRKKESSKAYFKLRTKAASRAYRKLRKKR